MADARQDRTALVTIAIADYLDGRHSAPPAGAAGATFASLFETPGGRLPEHVAHNRCSTPSADEAEVRAELRAWGAAGAEVGVLLWTGHCERDSAGRAHVCTSDTKVAAETLANWITECRFRRWVVIVDGCFAGSVIATLYPWLHETAVGPDQSCILLASANDTAPADAGRFTAAVAAVLADGPERGWWSTTDRFLDVWDLVERLDAELVRANPAALGTVPMSGGRVSRRRVFPNPRYRPRSTAVALDEAHFLPKARGIEAGETGWFFTGRTELLRRIVAWLCRPGGGFFVVTGPAGTGKSAVVARVVTLSVPEYRRLAQDAGALAQAPEGTVPPEGAVTAAFHARDKRVDQLLDFLADALGAREVRQVADLIVAARLSERQVVIAVDALDEAAAGHPRRMLDEVLARLARLPGVKVLLGTRPGVARWDDDGEEPAMAVADLSAEPDTVTDIAAYATRRLLALRGSSYADHPELARSVAEGVAGRASSDPIPDGRRVGSFLVARVLTKTLAARPPLALDAGWQERLPSGFAEAFEADLAAYGSRLGRPMERTIRDLLEGLAWDEGSGVPRRLVPVMTRAVTGRAVGDDDVAMLLREAAGHLLEAEAEGWAVYRLYHERLREHLRGVTRRRKDADG